MNAEDRIRIGLIVGLGLAIAVAAWHRRQGVKSGERLNRREEGLIVLVALRLFGLSLWGGTLAYVIEPEWMWWSELPLPHWVRRMGAVSGILSMGLLYWTFRHLGKNLTDTVVTRAKHTLVTTGPYRWVRHPFYGAVALVVVSAFLLTANWFIALLGVGVLVLLVIRTRKEEQKLIERFGGEYRSYMERTGRFVPRGE